MAELMNDLPADVRSVKRAVGVYHGVRYLLTKRERAAGYVWSVANTNGVPGLSLSGIEPELVNARGAAMRAILQLQKEVL